MAKLNVTLKRSVIGEKPKTRANVRALGLRKLHQTVEHEDTPDVLGMIQKVRHLVEVEEK
jgi:large subunit ribosomal protein L30